MRKFILPALLAMSALYSCQEEIITPEPMPSDPMLPLEVCMSTETLTKGLIKDTRLPDGASVGITVIIVGLIAYRTQYLAFQEALSGIDGEMSEKWLNQWNLYKISLLLVVGGELASVFLGVLGLVIFVAALGFWLFVRIRDLVYLYQTAQICRYFSEREN